MGPSPTKHALHDFKTKNFSKKITSPKIEKFYVLIFDLKTIQIVLITAQGERERVFGTNKRF